MGKYLSYEEIKNKLPKELLINLLKHKTYREIAKDYEVNERLISKIAQEDYQIPKNYKVIRHEANKNKVFNITKEELVDLYVNKKMSARQIGEFYNVQHTTIIQKLKDYEISIRPFNHEYYYWNRSCRHLKWVDMSGYYALVVNGEIIREHRYIMEQYLGRKLTEDETVHHIDMCRLNNDISNLFLFKTQQYHKLYHDFINKNEYITPEIFLQKYEWIINEVCSYEFLYDLYINQKMSANAIEQYIFDKYNYCLNRATVTKKLKEYGIHALISPTINQYDNRTCINEVRSKCS